MLAAGRDTPEVAAGKWSLAEAEGMLRLVGVAGRDTVLAEAD